MRELIARFIQGTFRTVGIRTLDRQFLVSFGVMAILAVAGSVLTFLGLRTEPSVVNRANQQLALVEEVTGDLLFMQAGAKDPSALGSARERFQANQQRLLQGDPDADIAAVETPAIRDRLAQSRRAFEAFVAVLVVDLAFLGILQDLVRLRGELELLLRLFIVGIAVGMVFEGGLSVRLLEFVLGCVARDTEYVVIVWFTHNTGSRRMGVVGRRAPRPWSNPRDVARVARRWRLLRREDSNHRPATVKIEVKKVDPQFGGSIFMPGCQLSMTTNSETSPSRPQ